MYIENKSFGHYGPAWIGFVEFSKSGQPLYFNDKALKKLKRPEYVANYFDIETGEEYWVSGVKKMDKIGISSVEEKSCWIKIRLMNI